MNQKQAFVCAFLKEAAERDLSEDQILQLTEELLQEKPIGQVKSAISLIGGVGQLSGLLYGAALGLPPVLGYYTGQALGDAATPQITPEEVQQQELVSEYERLAARARRAVELRKLREENEETEEFEYEEEGKP